MSKRILLAGGSHADIPIILAAKQAGHEVITSGNNPNDFGHIYGDFYLPADYSDPDAVLKIAQEHHVDALISSANDFSALSCSFVAEKLGLPGHDHFKTAQIIHHKDKFHMMAQKLGLNTPKAIRINKSEINHWNVPSLNYPVMIKPVDLTGGKGMSKVKSPQDFSKAMDKAFGATRKDHIVIEEYIEGSNHGYSTFLVNGKIVFGFMDDEHYYINPYLVSGASTSIKYSKIIARQLNNQLEILAKELKLVNGLLHVQFILQNEIPYIIEICRRTPGDLYVKLVEYATGFPMSDAIIKFALGEIPKDFSISHINWITRHCVMSQKNGNVCEVNYGVFSSLIFDKMVFFNDKNSITDYTTYKAEINFIRYTNKEHMQALQPILTEEISIRLC